MADTMIGVNSWTNHATFDVALRPLEIVLKFTVHTSLESGLHHATSIHIYDSLILVYNFYMVSLSVIFLSLPKCTDGHQKSCAETKKKVMWGVQKSRASGGVPTSCTGTLKTCLIFVTDAVSYVGRTLAWREWPKFKITAIVKQ